VTAPRAGRLGVVVVNYGSSALLAANLGPLALDPARYEVVVVDNLSTAAERTAAAALADAQGWRFVALPDNRGFAAGVNAGIRAARDAGCVCFLLLNPDAQVTVAVLDELRAQVIADPLALVSPRIVDGDGGVFFDGSVLHLDSGRIRSRRSADPRAGDTEEWVSGACLALHQDLLDRIGELDESYFLYWEDLDLSHRARRAGAHLVVRHDLTAVHDAGGTQGPRRGRAKSALYYRWNCRNRLTFAARHLSRRQLLRWMWQTPAVSREILLRGGRRQLLGQPRLLTAAVRGSVEGLAVAAAAVFRPRPVDRPLPVLVAHPGAELYGSDRMLAESVAGLLERGHPVTVALPGAGPLGDLLTGLGAEVVVCPMPVLRKSALSPAGALRLVADVLRGIGPAVRLVHRSGRGGVHVSTVTVPLWPVVGRLLGRRVTVHVHEAERGAPRVVRLLLALPTVLAAEVLVNSEFSRGVLAESLPRTGARAVLVVNGIAGPPVVVPPRAELSAPVQLCFVGRLSPRKGPQVGVAALAELTARGVDARLSLVGSVFAGYEWFEAELHEQVRAAGLADRVEFLGFVDDVWGALADADVVLIPSQLDEPFGNTAVEAVLAARPVVVSATSGLQEASAGYATAQAVAPADVSAWAAAVERVVRDWPAVAVQVLADAEQARRRHDPAGYRAQVAQLVVGTAPTAAGPDTRGRR